MTARSSRRPAPASRRRCRAATWGGWSRDEALRLFAAGGGSEDEFAQAWQARLRDSRDALAAIERGTMHSAGGTILYFVAGRRPL